MSNLTYVRWRRGESRRQRTFPALERDHPSYETPCVLCDYSLGSDTGGVQIVAVGPEDDEGRVRHEEDRWYSAVAVLVHTSCVAALSDEALETVIGELVELEEAE